MNCETFTYYGVVAIFLIVFVGLSLLIRYMLTKWKKW